MKHVAGSRAWRPIESRKAPRNMLGVWSALLFNICMVALPAAGAAAFFVIARDQLYAYDYSEAAARGVRDRVEDLSSGLILLDFDRRRQWDDLIANELMRNDIAAARGFLLSARAMLPPRDANQLDRRLRGQADDSEIELAALELLTPGTRARYEAAVPLLSRRSASGAVVRIPAPVEAIGDARDFELLARALLADANTDPTHFVLTGLGLGLGGEFTPRMAAGASALIDATRRDDFPPPFAEAFADLLGGVISPATFRAEAQRAAGESGDPGAFQSAAAAFRAAIDPERAQAATDALDEIGIMSETTSPTGATLLLTHARDLNDLPRLRLIAQSAQDRAVAAAKSLPRDGRLARAARGDLSYTRDLTFALIAAAIAAAGLVLAALAAAFQAIRAALMRLNEDIDGGELVESFNPPWKPL
jgi:hypothetical protein